MSFLSDSCLVYVSCFGFRSFERNLFVQVVATGPKVAEVAARLEVAATILAEKAGARVAMKSVGGVGGVGGSGSGSGAFEVPELAGRVWLGVSTVGAAQKGQHDEGSENTSPTVVGRFVAEYAEDVMRVLAACLEPLKPALGTVPYESRLHGSTAVPTAKPAFKAFPATPIPVDTDAAPAAAAAASASTPIPISPTPTPTTGAGGVTEELNTMQQWTIMQLTDASLPTGGFAHSGGLEAAVQLGVLPDPEVRTISPAAAESALLVYLQSALSSTTSLLNPFVTACHGAAVAAGVGTPDRDHDHEIQAALIDEIAALDRELDTLLVSVAPARRASTVQGAALVRVAHCWLETAGEASMVSAAGGGGGSGGSADAELFAMLRTRIGNGEDQLPCHMPCVMGLAAAALGLPASVATDALMFGTTRDMLAAAIRLNLVGPMRAVAIQAALSKTAAASSSLGGPVHPLPPSEAAGASPMLDTVHAMHDMLDMRLFQT